MADEPNEPVTGATIVDAPRRRERPARREIATATRLGHFQILEPLGHGGMGTVYSAYDLRLDRKVALKLLSKHDASPDHDMAQQRLLREAQAMAKLSHPNVVPVYEVGVDHDTVFIAMEYIDGRTVGQWLEQSQPGWREIVDVFVQAGRGIAAAHEVGVVHRDFKPSNVLVDKRTNVRVVDFGIAQVRGTVEVDDRSQRTPKVDFGDGEELTPPSTATPLTELGSVVGTPAYMSPEQHRGDVVDARSDQFSFCVALYEALFGARPFKGRGKTLADNVKQGVFDKPESKAVPSWVVAIVLRGLAVDPDQRFASMTTLVEALGHDPGRLRRRIGLAALGAVVIAAGATFAGWRLNAGRGDAACAGAEAHLVGSWDDTTRGALERSFAATGVPYAKTSVDRVATVLDRYRGAWIAMHVETCRATRTLGEQSEQLLDLRMACLDHRLGELRALTALLGDRIDAKIVEHAVDAATSLTPVVVCGDTTALLAPFAEARDPAARARRATLDRLSADRRITRFGDGLEPARALVAEARAAHDLRVLAEALDLQGVFEMHAGKLKSSELTLAEAFRRARQLGDIDLLATTGIDLASTLAEGGISQSREALGVIRFVEAFVDDTHDPALPIRLASEKADEYMVLARQDTALPILERSLAQARRVLGDDHVLVFQLQSYYAQALSRLGRHAEALAAYEVLIANTERVHGALHPTTLVARVHRCRIVADGGAIQRGNACFAAELPDAVRVIGGSDRELLGFRAYYASTLVSLHELEAARRVYAATLADVPADVWADKFFIAADMARALGAIEVELGDYQSGLEHCQRAEAATEHEHANPVGPTCIAEALLGLGKPDAALAVLEPLGAEIEGVDPAHLAAGAAQIGEWRFAYARATWAVHHQAGPARALARRARGELGEGAKRKSLDAWLATLPR